MDCEIDRIDDQIDSDIVSWSGYQTHATHFVGAVRREEICDSSDLSSKFFRFTGLGRAILEMEID